MREKKALVVFSGGQDSTTCLYWAKQAYSHVECITFNYGQKHSVEIVQSKKICDLLGVKQTIVDVSFLDTLVESALTSNGNVNDLNKLGLPASFVPNRNQLFLTLAHAYAQKIGALVVVTGVCQTDYSGYPDCREGFVRAIEFASNKGSGLEGTTDAIHFVTPLMNLTKAQTWELAEVTGGMWSVLEDSHTCYNGDRTHRHEWGYGCGSCPACQLRKKGWEEFQEQREQQRLEELKNQENGPGN